MNKALPLAAAVALLTSGCLYTNIHSPHAYRSAAPLDVKTTPADPVATGQACNQSVLWMFAWGHGGYIDAIKDALNEHPDAILYDVRTDIRIKSYVLGLYAKGCTVVSGKVGRL
jgi:hypothetical protein